MSIEPILQLGYLKEPNGIKGEITLKTQGELILKYKRGDELQLYKCQRTSDGFLIDSRYYNFGYLERISKKASKYLLKLEKINVREEAQKYCKSFIGIPLNKAIEKFGGSQNPYLFEYLTLEVIEINSQKKTGKVIKIETYNKNHVLIIETCNQKVLSVPVESPYIKRIDQKRRVLLTQNLLDLV